jgi:hypothetical protein
MARDRKATLAASIQAEREAAQVRVPRFDKFEKADAVLSDAEHAAGARAEVPRDAGARRRPTPARRAPAEKVIRDSFTMPLRDYRKITQLREKCLKAGINMTKSEILRAGLHALEGLSLERLREVVQSVEKVKTGRPGRT